MSYGTDSQANMRFEAALRIFLFELDRNREHAMTPAQVAQTAEAAVVGADVLLAALRKEKP